MKGLSPILQVILISLLVLVSLNGNGQASGAGFRPNKGQWPDQVEFRTELPNGTFYLEDGAFLFDLYDADRMAAFLRHHHGKSNGVGPETVSFHAYRCRFVGSQEAEGFEKEGKSRSYSNYYLSDDPSDWASKVHAYRQVTYRSLYPDIDLRVRGNEESGDLKYDLLIGPDGDPSEIELEYEGVDSLWIDDAGRLQVKTSIGTVTESRPKAFQRIDGEKKSVPCEYLRDGDQVRYRFPEGYREDRELIIDPTLVFSTYSGSYSDNFGYTATFDSEGFLYSGSSAFGDDYPTTPGAYQQNWAGGTGTVNIPGTDVAISKYDTSGTFMVWSTYLGGSYDELPHSMVVNENDELFVYGSTSSPDFPTTSSAYDTSFNGGSGVTMDGLAVDYVNGADIFISRLSDDGTALLASTFFGGTGNDGLNTDGQLRYNYADEVRGEIIIDSDNRCYIASTTRSTDLPTTAGTIQPGYPGGKQSGCVFKMDNQLTTLLWSSYFGGSNEDAVYSLTLDSQDDLFISGGTNSSDLPTDTSVIQPNNAGGRADAFVAHLSSSGDSLYRSTYWGSSDYDQSYFVRLDGEDHVHLLGQTEIMDSTYIIDAGYATPQSGQYITQMNTEMDSIIWSTVFGSGSSNIDISPTAFLVDVCNKIYLSGWGGATNNFSGLNNNTGSTYGMDISGNAYQSSTDGSDFYLMVLQDDANGIAYGSYMGGSQSAEHVDGGTSRFNKKGEIYQSVCAGCGGNSDFPIKPDPGAVSATNNSSNCNNAVFKMDFDSPIAVADMDHPGTACKDDTVPFSDQSKSTGKHQVHWYFGDGDSSSVSNPTHVYDTAGTFKITLAVTDTNSCNLRDTVRGQIRVLSDTSRKGLDTSICRGDDVGIGIPPLSDSSVTYTWTPGDGLSDSTEPNPIASPDSSTDYSLVIDRGACKDTLNETVNVLDPQPQVSIDHPLGNCVADTIPFNGSLSGAQDPKWYFGDGDSSSLIDPDHVYGQAGTYQVRLKARDSNGCGVMDTARSSITLLSDSSRSLSDTLLCEGDQTRIGIGPISDSTVDHTWAPISGLNDTSLLDPIASPDSSIQYTLYLDNGNCSDTLKETIDVQRKIDTVAFDHPIGNCKTDTIPFTDLSQGGGNDYHWDFGDGSSSDTTDPVHVYGSSGTFGITLTVSDTNGCGFQDSAKSFVSLLEDTTREIGDSVLCYGDSAQIGIDSTIQDSAISFHWDPTQDLSDSNVIDPIASPGKTTDYTLILSNGNCSDTLKERLEVADPRAQAYSDTSFCRPSDSIELRSVPKSPGQIQKWRWIELGPPADTVEEGASDSTLNVLPTDTSLYMIETEAGGCVDRDTVTVKPSLLSVELKGDSAICSIDTMELEASVNGSGPLSYDWEPDASILQGDSTKSITVAPNVTTTFTVTVSNGVCTETRSSTISVSDLHRTNVEAEADPDSIAPGETSNLQAEPDSGFDVRWTPSAPVQDPTAPSTTAELEESSQFILKMSDNGACPQRDTVDVFVYDIECGRPDLFLPNAFSPNGDGVNDVLYVRGRNIEEMTLRIFDRWGEKVFESHDPEKGWDGTYQGRKLDPDVYAYYLEVTCIGGKEFFEKGNITLIR